MKPITVEYLRRFIVLVLLALFSWIYFYTPSDIYNIKVQNYAQSYKDKVRWGWVDASTSLEAYIAKEMGGAYWKSSKKSKMLEVEGEAGDFLKRLVAENSGELVDDFMKKHHKNGFLEGRNYFFRADELPEAFTSKRLLKDADYLSVVDETGEKHYFDLYHATRNFSLRDAPTFIKYPLEHYAYLLLILALLVYLFIPKPRVPQGAAYYTRFNAVYLADILGFSLWMGAWMFFFLPDDSAPMLVRYLFLAFFAIFALAIVLPTCKYASNWYLFTKETFRYSDSEGVAEVALKDIVSIKPYKKQLPKWLSPLLILFGRGQPVPTGAGMISMSASPELGMEIGTKFGKKIKVMANYLETDKTFTERFQALEERVGKNAKKMSK